MTSAAPCLTSASLSARPAPRLAPLLPMMPAMLPRPAAPVQTGALSAAQEQLLAEHLPLVRYVARAVAERLPPHIEFEELVAAGMLGLVDAARKFRASKNVQFRSYAQFRVRGAMLDSLRTLDWGPRELRRRGRALRQARQALEARLGRMATESELAKEMNLSLGELQTLSGDLHGLEIAALNSERGGESDEEVLAFLPAPEKENPLLALLAGEAREKLAAAIDALPERERLVMRLYYFEEMTMRQIGEVLGVVESRISQIHHETLRRLRHALGCLRPGRAALGTALRPSGFAFCNGREHSC